MGYFRFQKRIGIVPGLRINLSKSGASVSLGVKGAHLTVGKTPRVTVGLPGSGLSYTETLGSRRRGQPTAPLGDRIVGGIIGLAIGFGLLALFVAAFGG